MPLTLSHVAAVLPLSRRPLVVSALVAGSIAPDLPYVLPQATSAAWGPYSDFNLTYTHEYGTGLIAGPVIALVLLAIYHQLLKHPLVALLPPGAAGRVTDAASGFRWSGPKHLVWIVVSAAIGVLTHLAWDGIVHDNGSTGGLPFLKAGTATEVLWWASTLGGVLVLAGWLYRWWRRTPCRPVRPSAVLGRAARWAVLAGLVTAGALGAVIQLTQIGSSLLDAAQSPAALREAVTGAMSGGCVGLLAYAVMWQIRARRTAERAEPGVRVDIDDQVEGKVIDTPNLSDRH